LYTFSTPLVRGSRGTRKATQSSSATMRSQRKPNEGTRGAWEGVATLVSFSLEISFNLIPIIK
jgi:hypothetical protein